MASACFCGMDAVANCQGPCGRRLCARHALLEIRELSALEDPRFDYRPPSDEILTRIPSLEIVARIGFASGLGRRCSSCRNGAAEQALEAVDRGWPDDPIERMLWQYEHFGEAERFPAGGWGSDWSTAARRRSIPFDTYHVASGGWEKGETPVIDGRPVWRFVRPDRSGSGQGSKWADPEQHDLIVVFFDAEGNSPVQTPGPLKRRLFQSPIATSVTTWTLGPAGGMAKSRWDESWPRREFLDALVGFQPALRTPPNGEWLGLSPPEIFPWLAEGRA